MAQAVEINVNMSDVLADVYRDIFEDVMNHRHSRYVLPGGRGSLKSSTISVLIPLLIMNYPNVHAVCFRQVQSFVTTRWLLTELLLNMQQNSLCTDGT